jgi:FKBP-type peptidyl-prolyl cis-trans isomerase
MTSGTTSRALLALVLATALTACGSGDGADDPTLSQPSTTPTTSAPRSPVPTAAPSAAACEQRPGTAPAPEGASTDLTTKPTVAPSSEAPPCGLVLRDIAVGDGAEAVRGAQTALKYVGAFYETGEEFDSSWSRGADETLPVQVGAGRVIPGFDMGILGMKVGGRRHVTIPSDLGYGPRGQGPIPPDATLVFVIDLVEATPAG